MLLLLRLLLRNGISNFRGFHFVRSIFVVTAFIEVLFHHFMFESEMPHEAHLRLAGVGVRAQMTLGRRILRNQRGQSLVEMLTAIMIVERPGVQQHLLANLALELLDFVQRPILAQFPLHQDEHDFVREAVVTRQVEDVFGLVRALGAIERPLVGDLGQHEISEMTQQVDPFVPNFVHTVVELLPAQLARRHVALHVDGLGHGQGGHVGRGAHLLGQDFPGFFRLALGLGHVQVLDRGHGLGQAEVHLLQHDFLQIAVTPNVVADPRLLSRVGQSAQRALFGLVLNHALHLPPQVIVHEMAAQVEPAEISVIA